MKAYERKGLLERVEREGATVGTTIPEEITVQGEPVALRSFVLDVQGAESVPPGERDRVERAKRNLRRERLERRQRLERAELSREEGEQLVESIVGIDRALEALSQLGPANLEGQMAAQELADQQRWTAFLKQVLGNDDASTRRRR